MCAVCVCLFAEGAHCLAADCMLAETLLCVIMGGKKTHTSEFTHNDKNRHLNAHMVFEEERLCLRGLDVSLTQTLCLTYCTYND